MSENEISFKIRKAIYEVYEELGPGLLESSYEFALKHELESEGLQVKSQIALPLKYKGLTIENAYKLDLLVEDKVIIELKSVETISRVHHKQLITYLKLSDLRLGILVNFNADYLKDNIFRKVNGLQS
ncbi:GxxExxY protein [uncultured Fluviicola sp.]|uniref:GxxExxY protein n=1 Tax=uncultured Fluviicola sp. TaxID=463303 RepID=UPI0025F2C431|nr:GxxExxY protein [uncultured Fluviicola sp.]